MAAAQKIRFEAGPKDAGRRLDQVLADNVPGLSRRKARVLLDIGGVFVDGARVKVAGKTIRKGQKIEAVLGGAFDRATPKTGKAARAKDEEVLPAFDVVYEDADVVVVDKPAGLLTAPTPESDRGNLAKLLAARFGQIFVVHRIDLETSGLLVFARTEEANRVLSLRYSTHDIGEGPQFRQRQPTIQPHRFLRRDPFAVEHLVLDPIKRCIVNHDNRSPTPTP